MKPATKKMDAKVWELWKSGVAPKDIAPQMGITISQVRNAMRRQRVRIGIMPKKRVQKRAKTGKRRRR